MQIRLIVLIGGLLGFIQPLGAEEQSASATITFLSEDKARTALLDDTREPYFSKLQPLEIAAKSGAVLTFENLDQQRNACRDLYARGVMNFTDAEREAISWHVAKLQPFVAKHYPAFGALPWSFLKVSNRIEGGMPHACGPHIVFSEEACAAVVGSLAPDKERKRFKVQELLMRKQVHVFQHSQPRLFDSLYSKVWGYEKMEKTPSHLFLTNYQVLLREAMDCGWAVPVKDHGQATHLWPLVIFTRGRQEKSMEKDLRMVAVELRKEDGGFVVITDSEGIPVLKEQSSYPELQKLLPLPTPSFHPAEASADLIARMLMVDRLMAEENLKLGTSTKEELEKNFGALRNWLLENTRLATAPSPK